MIDLFEPPTKEELSQRKVERFLVCQKSKHHYYRQLSICNCPDTNEILIEYSKRCGFCGQKVIESSRNVPSGTKITIRGETFGHVYD